MAGMYPDNQIISLFGEEITWPGVDPKTGKFTNGDFSNPLKKPSFIPAETINLILDNLTSLITGLGGSPNNTGTDQLTYLIKHSRHEVGDIIMRGDDISPAILYGGTWTLWGEGRTPVGVDITQEEFNEVEKLGGEIAHVLTKEEMPSHTHTQNQHRHTVTIHNSAQAGTANLSGTSQTASAVDKYSSYTTATNQNTGEGLAHNNLQPYIVCYMWKKTA